MHIYPQNQSSVGSSRQTITTNVSMTPCNWQICHQNHILCGCTTFRTESNWVRNSYGPDARCRQGCSLDKGGGGGGFPGGQQVESSGKQRTRVHALFLPQGCASRRTDAEGNGGYRRLEQPLGSNLWRAQPGLGGRRSKLHGSTIAEATPPVVLTRARSPQTGEVPPAGPCVPFRLRWHTLPFGVREGPCGCLGTAAWWAPRGL